jgi:hypothetical protein
LEERAIESLNFFAAEKNNSFDVEFYARLTLPFLDALAYVASRILENPTGFNALSDVVFIRQMTVEMASDESLEYRRDYFYIHF